jgi:hypothetical protein
MAGFDINGSRLEPLAVALLGYTGFWRGPNVGPPGFTSKFWVLDLGFVRVSTSSAAFISSQGWIRYVSLSPMTKVVVLTPLLTLT